MKHMKINPVTIVQEYVKELHHQYRASDDPTKKRFWREGSKTFIMYCSFFPERIPDGTNREIEVT